MASDACVLRLTALLLLVGTTSFSAERGQNIPLQQGARFQFLDHMVIVRRIDMLPFVENDYSRRFRFDRFENPKLAQLRSGYRLDEVVAPGKDEFDRQVLLMDWTHHQFKKFGQPSTNAAGALSILKGIEDGQTFFCSQYAQVFVSAAASLGWIDRPLALRRHQDHAGGGSTEHTATEIWSNQHRKWVMLDPTSNMYLEKEGVPLSAYEIRQEWFYHDGHDLTFVVGRERRPFRKSDLPIRLETFPGFGTLSVDPDELDKYGFTAYIPNNDLMDSGFDYAKMFIVKDQLCDGTKWHVRVVPKDPATDCYFPLGQAALELRMGDKSIDVKVKTFTPNFSTYDGRYGTGQWKPFPERFSWTLQPGSNALEIRTVNKFGVKGPISRCELVME
jgi:hypothetical protein